MLEDKDNIEINPLDMLDDIQKRLQGYTFEIHRADDEEDEYDYLEEGSVCITVLNPYQDNNLFIDLSGEFTLTFDISHCHYFAELDDYDNMLSDVLGILKNECCSAALYYGQTKKWLGSGFIRKEELSKPIKTLFSYVLRIPEFRKKLNSQGGEVQFQFWNPVDDRTVVVPKQSQ